MLELTLSVSAGEHAEYRDDYIVEVGNVGGGALADYLVRLRTYDDGIVAQAALAGYPRWSESAQALVARGLAALWRAPGARRTRPRPPPAALEAQLCLRAGLRAPQRLASWRLELRPQPRLALGTPDLEPALRPVPVSGADWQTAALQAQCLSAFGTPGVPAWPRPLQVPSACFNGIAYVRLRDIPEPARAVFAQRMRDSGRPCVPDAPDAVFLWDWTAFVEGRR